ncbi:hypothetical protein PRIPAC_89017, partial [Pristionchus pacificus]|uniref:Uncharacterized protein n=1 Tax=Pristionchus pacificus TaxID=54126 RepID=A0A2A6B6Q2_PRIPA
MTVLSSILCLFCTIFSAVLAGKKKKDDDDDPGLTPAQSNAVLIAIMVILCILLAAAIFCFCCVGAENIPVPKAEPTKTKKKRETEKDEESALDADGVEDDVSSDEVFMKHCELIIPLAAAANGDTVPDSLLVMMIVFIVLAMIFQFARSKRNATERRRQLGMARAQIDERSSASLFLISEFSTPYPSDRNHCTRSRSSDPRGISVSGWRATTPTSPPPPYEPCFLLTHPTISPRTI